MFVSVYSDVCLPCDDDDDDGVAGGHSLPSVLLLLCQFVREALYVTLAHH